MASLRTPASVAHGQSIVLLLRISACVTGDTVTVPPETKAVFAVNESTTDAISATLAAGVATITVANTPNVAVWCLL
jgi:ABC-type Fe3+-hydroxamate transport system substrate-binding protein